MRRTIIRLATLAFVMLIPVTGAAAAPARPSAPPPACPKDDRPSSMACRQEANVRGLANGLLGALPKK